MDDKFARGVFNFIIEVEEPDNIRLPINGADDNIRGFIPTEENAPDPIYSKEGNEPDTRFVLPLKQLSPNEVADGNAAETNVGFIANDAVPTEDAPENISEVE